MHVSTRSYLTSGVALLGAGAVALSPVAPTIGAAPAVNAPAHFVSQAVELAAATTPTPRLLEVGPPRATNYDSLFNADSAPGSAPPITGQQAPLPTLQQFVANWIGYAAILPNFADIISDIFTNLQAAVAVPFGVDTNSLDEAHGGIYSILPEDLQSSLGFTTSFATGALLGLVGPFVAPVLAFSTSMKAVVNSFLGGDFGDALIELINTPANLVDAFLNGGPALDLGPLLTAIGVLPISPTPGVSLTDVEVAMGGLLSKGGSLFNALGLGVTIGDTTIPIPGAGPGAIGSLIGLGGAFAQAIGWSGTGNPLNPTIPVPGPAAAAAAAASVAAEAADDADVAGADDSAGVAPDRNAGKGTSKAPRGKSSASSSDNSGGASAGHAAKTGKSGAKRRGHAA